MTAILTEKEWNQQNFVDLNTSRNTVVPCNESANFAPLEGQSLVSNFQRLYIMQLMDTY